MLLMERSFPMMFVSTCSTKFKLVKAITLSFGGILKEQGQIGGQAKELIFQVEFSLIDFGFETIDDRQRFCLSSRSILTPGAHTRRAAILTLAPLDE